MFRRITLLSLSSITVMFVMCSIAPHMAEAKILFNTRIDYPAGERPSSVAIGDLDGDGDLDLAVANWYSDNVSVLLGNGDGTFQSAVNYGAGEYPSSVAIGDLDGDGDLDLAVANTISNNVSVLINIGADPDTSVPNGGGSSGGCFIATGFCCR